MPAKKSKPKAKNSKQKNSSGTNQKELVLVMIISLILGTGGGYLIGTNTSDKQTSSTVSSNEMKAHSSTYDVSAEEAPKVELVVTEDPKSGYNVKIITTDFTFTPENVNENNVSGEGHAHLYVDGEKVGRLYGPYFHYDASFEGTKTFKVALNANDHSEYTVDGVPLTSEVAVTHDGSDPEHDDKHSEDM